VEHNPAMVFLPPQQLREISDCVSVVKSESKARKEIC
jgi:hypothetical protein